MAEIKTFDDQERRTVCEEIEHLHMDAASRLCVVLRGLKALASAPYFDRQTSQDLVALCLDIAEEHHNDLDLLRERLDWPADPVKIAA